MSLRSPLIWGANLLARATAARLRRLGDGCAAQAAVYRHLMARFATTRFGRANGLRGDLPYPEFQARVPLRTYEDFHDSIEQMKRGATDILWPGRCDHYAVSSGTTAGRTKYIPVSREMLRHFSRCGLDSLSLYASRAGHARLFQGRHLFMGGATELTPLAPPYNPAAVAGDLSGITALNMPAWADRLIYEPGLHIARSADWPKKIRAIIERCRSRDITLIAGIPTWILILFEQLRERTLADGRPFDGVRSVWPNLEVLVHGGVPLGPFRAELQRWLGPRVAFHEVYPASEGFIACQDIEAEAGLRLLVDAGIFYEFLPMAEFDEARLGELGPRAVPLAEVRPGVPYAVVMTTPAGLCRYLIGDVVKFASTLPPRLFYAGRTRLHLSAFGEHVIEKELTDSIAACLDRRGWSLAFFHAAPLIEDLPGGQRRNRHEWWIELRETPPAPDLPALAADLDRELALRNDDYNSKRAGHALESPAVRLVPAGTFEHWMKANGKWGGQNKMPRCRSDRLVADALATLAAG